MAKPKAKPRVWSWEQTGELASGEDVVWAPFAIAHLGRCEVTIAKYDPTLDPPVKISIGLPKAAKWESGELLSWKTIPGHRSITIPWSHFASGSEWCTDFMSALLNSMGCYPKKTTVSRFRILSSSLAHQLQKQKAFHTVMDALAASYDSQLANLDMAVAMREYERRQVRKVATKKRLFKKYEEDAVEFVTTFVAKFGLEDSKDAASILYRMSPEDLKTMAFTLEHRKPVLQYVDKDRFERGFNLAVISRVLDK